MSESLEEAVPEPLLLRTRSYAGERATVGGQFVPQVIKSGIDVVLGAVLMLLAVPVIVVLAIVLAVRLGQWPFFMHHRIGQGGRMITFPKLRTLPKSTAPYALKDGGLVIPADRFCAFLRRRHFDELPQLLLVPVLKMSLVGPRPKMPDRWEPVHPGYRDARTLVRQGCTGLWQVGHDSHRLVHESPAYDFSYLQYGSLRMDLWILWRTALLMVGGPPVQLTEMPPWVIGQGWVAEQRIHAAGGARFLVRRGDIAVQGGRR
ncbi:MAG: sugar transferase [Haloechinothrix sp.]